MVADGSHNVVLLCLDSVRKDFFDIYAQRLREAAGVEFAQCRAASSWSTPSHASMFSGQLPHRHGIHTHDRSFDSLARGETFLAALDEYTTLSVSENVFAGSAYDFDQLFDVHDEPAPGQYYPDALSSQEFAERFDGGGIEQYARYLVASLSHERPLRSLANGVLTKTRRSESIGLLAKLLGVSGPAVMNTAEQRIENVSEPYFAFLNVMEAHVPLRYIWGLEELHCDVPDTWTSAERGVWELFDRSRDHSEYWRNRRALYGMVIEYLDRYVSEFVERVQAHSDLETTVIVTADHGENLGYEAENYLANHKSSLSEGLLHVPLSIINPPNGYETTEHTYFSHLDLGRLITGMAHGKTPDVFRHRIPAEVIGLSAGPEPPVDYDYAELDRLIRCVYNGERKIEWDSLGRSFEYSIDHERPCWQAKTIENVEVPEWATSFFDAPAAESKRHAREQSRSQTVDAATASRLEELGYL